MSTPNNQVLQGAQACNPSLSLSAWPRLILAECVIQDMCPSMASSREDVPVRTAASPTEGDVGLGLAA